MQKWLPDVLLLVSVACPVSVAAQARIDVLVPATAAVEVQRLGSDHPEVAAPGMDLVPGDLVSSTVEGVSLTLRCSGEEGDNTYDLASPFRVLIDVPSNAPCHINLLSGTTEVTAEAPSQTSAGGVTLGSTGTEYAVEIRQEADSLVFRCTIFTDSVSVAYGSTVIARAGSNLIWNRGGAFDLTRISKEQLVESAAFRARFDLAAAQGKGSAPDDSGATFQRLQTLHYQVLEEPNNTERSVELARALLDIQLPDRARYNLEKADIRSDDILRNYQIDPGMLRSNLRPPSRPTVTTRYPVSVRRPTATNDPLQRLESGRVDDAVSTLKERVQAGTATSRDYAALAKAYGGQGELSLARANAGRALVLHAQDGLLTPADLRELGELIARIG